jgi:murein DD-endopeptidase MepM/ murein hydrolase activator NlpD
MQYPDVRKCDKWGCGHFGASRGSRKHNGEDFVTSQLNEEVRAFAGGVVTKIHYPYGDDLSFRYIELKCGDYFCRYFYVRPSSGIELGKKVHAYEVLGLAQSLEKRYPEITPHYHFEVFTHHENGKPANYIHPRDWIEGLS